MEDIIKEPSEFLFVYEDHSEGWWWRCSNLDDLLWYHRNSTLYGDAIMYYAQHPEMAVKEYRMGEESKLPKEERRIRSMVHGILMYISSRNLRCTFPEACRMIRNEVAMVQNHTIRTDGAILINSVGGYHGDTKYSQWVIRKSFVFPDYTKNDIKITQYADGRHWYVRMGDMELHNGSEIKWNTRKEAEAAAMKYITTV